MAKGLGTLTKQKRKFYIFALYSSYKVLISIFSDFSFIHYMLYRPHQIVSKLENDMENFDSICPNDKSDEILL